MVNKALVNHYRKRYDNARFNRQSFHLDGAVHGVIYSKDDEHSITEYANALEEYVRMLEEEVKKLKAGHIRVLEDEIKESKEG